MQRSKWSIPALALCLAFLAAGCGDPGESGLLGPGPQFDTGADGPTVTLCKVGTPASFSVSLDGGAPFTVDLNPGECEILVTATGGRNEVTVTELPNPDIQLDYVLKEVFFEDGTLISSETLPGPTTTGVAGDVETILTYHNSFVGTGRMTGGGSQITMMSDEVRITRGFTIHCDITLSNNLQINWPDNTWHIDKPLTSAICTDDPNVDPEPPPAPFDTFEGEGIGRLNGADGSMVWFVFRDSGEPGGKQDMAEIKIWDPDGNLVLHVPWQVLEHGNAQAHWDQPHGCNVNKPC